MESEILIKLIGGEQLHARLAAPFDPRDNQVEAIDETIGLRLAYPLLDISHILLSDPTISPPADLRGIPLETVEVVTGERFTICPSGRPVIPRCGFFAIPIGLDSPFNLVFLPPHGILRRTQNRLLGDILEERGLVDNTQLQEMLQKQRKLRKRRLGEIISETHDIPQATVEKTFGDPDLRRQIPANARIGDILVAAGLVTREQVEEAVAAQRAGKKKRIGQLLIDHGLITEEQLLSALATKFNLEFVDLDEVTPSQEALSTLPLDLVSKLHVLPVALEGNYLRVATSQPTDPAIFDALSFHTNCTVELLVAHSEKIAKAIERNYVKSDIQVASLINSLGDTVEMVEEETSETRYSESDSQIIKLVNTILLEAQHQGASDIHFEPGLGQHPLQVRYRIDGVCRIAHQIAAAYKFAIIARLKIISRLDIAEHRRPQSGKILLRAEGRPIEYRVEITPTVGGHEDAVLRLLTSSKPLPLERLDFTPANYRAFTDILAKPYGIILCVGPTGSGKTTTLHSALHHINRNDRKIWTAEDPVEITQPGLRQVQVFPKIGFTFQEALRSFLRADPDVIMIGEMRDPETARAAIEASLTGHLVFSTLHTNNASETVVRLIEMGMVPYNFANAVLGILAQRLGRTLCIECKERYAPSQRELDELLDLYGRPQAERDGLHLDAREITLMKPVGCSRCEGTGYRGRIAIHELLLGTESVREAIKEKQHGEQIRNLALGEGMRTLKMDGIWKVLKGKTTMEQVLRVCM